MTLDPELISTIFKGWRTYQETVIQAIRPLDADQLASRSSPKLRSVAEITAHMIGARARWFYMLMGEGGEEFKSLGRWDHRNSKPKNADELILGLEATWKGMHEAIGRWTPEEWKMTWPGEDDSEPEEITRQWVIWHLIEHDLHHGGEISIALGAHEVPALQL